MHYSLAAIFFPLFARLGNLSTWFFPRQRVLFFAAIEIPRSPRKSHKLARRQNCQRLIPDMFDARDLRAAHVDVERWVLACLFRFEHRFLFLQLYAYKPSSVRRPISIKHIAFHDLRYIFHRYRYILQQSCSQSLLFTLYYVDTRGISKGNEISTLSFSSALFVLCYSTFPLLSLRRKERKRMRISLGGVQNIAILASPIERKEKNYSI